MDDDRRAMVTRRLKEKYGRELRRFAILAVVLAMPFFLLPAFVIPHMMGLLHSSFWLLIASGAVLGMVGPLAMGLILHRLMLGRLVRALVDERCCGCCAYDLSDLDPEHDGCTVCPECGSAWRVAGQNTPA